MEAQKIATDEVETELNDAIPFKFRKIKFDNFDDEKKFKNEIDRIFIMLMDIAKQTSDQTYNFENYNSFYNNFKLLESDKKSSFLKKAINYPNFIKRDKTNADDVKLQIEKICTSLIKCTYENIKLRYSRDAKQYTSKKKMRNNKNNKTGSYGRLNLDYNAFVYIIDTMQLMNYIDQETIPYYKINQENNQSRIQFTELGYNRFMNIQSSLYINEEKKYNDLIVMKDRFDIQVETHNDKQKKKTISKSIPYEITDHVRVKIKNIKRINDKYETTKLSVKVSNFSLNDQEFTNNLLCYHLSKSINIKHIFLNSKDLIPLYLNKQILKYYVKNYNLILKNTSLYLNTNLKTVNNSLNNINTNSTPFTNYSIKDISNSSSLFPFYKSPPSRRYLMEKDELVRSNEEMHCQKIDNWFTFNELEFDILNLDLHRVFSRNSQSRHGRFYSFYTNFPKKLRQYFYLNDCTTPMVSRDFSSFHIFLAYHRHLIETPSEIYNIKGFDEKLMKKAALISLNVERSEGKNPYQGAVNAIYDNVFEKNRLTRRDAKEYLMGFINHHKKYHKYIENYIANDQGIRAMYLDGMIMEDLLMNLVVYKNIIALPYHDEILIQPDSVDVAERQMTESYRKIMAGNLDKEIKVTGTYKLPEWVTPKLH